MSRETTASQATIRAPTRSKPPHFAPAPPDHPQFPDLAAQNLVITNTAGVIALRLTCATDPGENTIVRVNQFVDGWEDLRALPAQVPVHSGT